VKSLRAVPPWKWLVCGAVAMAVLGAKLWIISRYANPTPLNDEWDLHAAFLFVPYFDSTLSLQQLLAAHNEHRMFTTRVIALLLLAANGLWDPTLEMIVNAAIHVTLGVCILVVFGRHLDEYWFAALAVVTAALLAVPNAIENPVWGLETHFYCVLLFGLIAINLMTTSAQPVWRRIAGTLAATLSFLSLASGGIVFLACAVVVMVKRFLGVERGSREWAFAAFLLACFAGSMMLTPIIEAHRVYRAHSVAEFLRAFAMVAGWPIRVHLVAATVFVNAPLLALAWLTLRKPPPSDSIVWVLLGLGLSNGLQFAALAFGRAYGIEATRYLDICAFNLIVNFICAVIMCGTGRRKLVAAAWIAVIAVGWAVQTARHVPQELQSRYAWTLRQEENVKVFLATGAFPARESGPDQSLPYPIPERLVGLLSDPRIRRFLPSPFQSAPAPSGDGAVRRDRLAGIRDAILGAGPYLAIAGLLLMLLLISAMPWARLPGKPGEPSEAHE
jgi:hypothetical protein